MPTLFDHTAIVETAQPEKLEQLLAAGLRRYVVRTLGPTAVQVDHERLADVHKLLKRLGETPRVTAE
jgi:hypothetical protein